MKERVKTHDLVIAEKEKAKLAAELVTANKEKAKREAELVIANKERAKRAAELLIANKELTFQKEEKEKHANDKLISSFLQVSKPCVVLN